MQAISAMSTELDEKIYAHFRAVHLARPDVRTRFAFARLFYCA